MRTATISMFAQIVQQIPKNLFHSLVHKYQTDRHSKGLSTWDQFIAMMFCQISGAESLREISDGLFSSLGKLNHIGAHAMARSTLSYANQHRNFQVYQDFYYQLLEHFHPVLKGARIKRVCPDRDVFSLDSTTIGLCLKLYDWAKFRHTKGGIKLHTLLNHDTLMPEFISITEAKVTDITAARTLVDIPKNCVLIMDRGYYDFLWYQSLTERGVTFVTRIKDNIRLDQCQKILEDESKQWGCYRIILHRDQEAFTKGTISKVPRYRLIQWKDVEQNRWFEFLTNDFRLTAKEIADIYRDRWQIELFFKRIKQNLRIRTFVGTSLNAVMIQIWTALIVTLLLTVLKRKAKYPWSFSRLCAYLRLNLMTHKVLEDWLDEPDIIPRFTPENSPQKLLFE